ncbi:MAG: MgtC/SapB family protein [Ruminococcaceae bacterium]|nr:MgtC/SapB family protein [Oscillospiraceae bacterium]
MDWIFQLELILRILLAGACGLLIGLERKNRGKEAGVRTHLIVALSSALMMVISKYAFFDVIAIGQQMGADMRLDGSRVAAGIVQGVGFLGAGMIFIHKKTVTGLTTAAGIWATCGVGMAIGAGLYFIGISSAVLIYIIQIILHKKFHVLQSPTIEALTIVIENDPDLLERVLAHLDNDHILIEDIKIQRQANNCIQMELSALLPTGYCRSALASYAVSEEGIHSIDL